MAGLAHPADDDPAGHAQDQRYGVNEGLVHRRGQLAERRRLQPNDLAAISEHFGILEMIAPFDRPCRF
jgi:hypothetical protein